MEPVKGSREISLRNAALRSVSRLKRRPLIGQARGQLRLTWRSYAGPPQSVSHGVSFHRSPSYTLSRCAGLPFKGKQDVTGLPSCFLSTLNILLNWPPWAAPPLSRFAGLPPKGETTHYILRVAIAPSKCVRCASTGKRVTRFSGRFAPLQHGYHRLTIFCASLRSFIHCCH